MDDDDDDEDDDDVDDDELGPERLTDEEQLLLFWLRDEDGVVEAGLDVIMRRLAAFWPSFK